MNCWTTNVPSNNIRHFREAFIVITWIFIIRRTFFLFLHTYQSIFNLVNSKCKYIWCPSPGKSKPPNWKIIKILLSLGVWGRPSTTWNQWKQNLCSKTNSKTISPKHLFSKDTLQHEKMHTQASWQLWHVPLSEYLRQQFSIVDIVDYARLKHQGPT